jgi:predicted DNA-binding transcriptional regulator AlpA
MSLRLDRQNPLAGALNKGPSMTSLRKALRLPAVIEATGLAKPTIYKKIAEGKFPAGMRREDVRLRVWFADEIEAYQKGEWKPAEIAA